MLQPAVMVSGKKVILSKLTAALGGVGQFSVARDSFDLLFLKKTNTYYLKQFDINLFILTFLLLYLKVSAISALHHFVY